MKTLSVSAVLLFAVIFIAACSSSSNLTKNKWTVTVSRGGGFSGQSTGFSMIETGEVFLWNGKEGDHEGTNKIGSVSVERAHDFKEILAANLDTIHLNSPGNMSTTIQLEEEGHTRSITWGSTDHPDAPEELKEWYNDFMQLCGGMQSK